MPAAWSDSADYALGDVVTHGGHTYEWSSADNDAAVEPPAGSWIRLDPEPAQSGATDLSAYEGETISLTAGDAATVAIGGAPGVRLSSPAALADGASGNQLLWQTTGEDGDQVLRVWTGTGGAHELSFGPDGILTVDGEPIGASVADSVFMAYSSSAAPGAHPGGPVAFDNPPDLAVGTDVTIGEDDETITIVTAGRYVIQIDVGAQASADTVLGKIGVHIDTSLLDSGNLLAAGNSGQFCSEINGAALAAAGNDWQSTTTTVPVPFLAGSEFKIEAEFDPAAGSVGTLSYFAVLLTIVRVA